MNIIQQYPDILNYTLLILALSVLFYKMDVNKKLSQLKENIKKYVEDSENEKTVSIQNLNKINEKIEKLPLEIQDIENAAKANVNGLKEKIQREIELKKKNMDETSNRLLSLESKNFKQKLTGMLTAASVKLARDNAIEQLKDNEELHNQYIQQAIRELDEIEL